MKLRMLKSMGLLVLGGTCSFISAMQDKQEVMLFNAVCAGRLEKVHSFFDDGVSIDMRSTLGDTPLLVATDMGQENMVRFLLAKGADPKIVDALGRTALDVARIGKYAEIITLLEGAQAGDLPAEPLVACVKAKKRAPKKGGVQFLSAAEHGDITKLNDMLAQTDIHYTDELGMDALMHSCQRGQDKVVDFLFERGARCDHKDLGGKTAFHWAVLGKRESTIALLLAKGVLVDQLDEQGATPLMYAAREGSDSIVSLLLKYHAVIDARDSKGQTALMCAVNQGHAPIAHLLLKEGADVDAKDNDGNTALARAEDAGNRSMQEILQDQINYNDALLHAAKNGDQERVNALLKHGAQINARDFDNGRTSLMIAIVHGQSLVAAELLKVADININIRDKHGRTACMYAAREGDGLFLKTLIEAGADCNAQDDEQSTALMFAAYNGHQKCARLLLKSGVSTELKDFKGDTAEQLAEKKGHHGFGLFLKKYGKGA